ncbi:MAG: hypothetical protein RR034_06840 [Bacteroidales bacterium]
MNLGCKIGEALAIDHCLTNSCVSDCNEKPGMERSGMRTCSGRRDGEAGTPGS